MCVHIASATLQCGSLMADLVPRSPHSPLGWCLADSLSPIIGSAIALVHATKTLTGISLIAISVELVSTGGCLDTLILLDSFYPARPTATSFRFRPAAVRCQHLLQPNDPRCELDVNEGNVGAEKERTGLISGLDDLLDSFCELLRLLDLVATVLSLK